MSDTFGKTVFIWTSGAPIRTPAARLSFVPVGAELKPRLIEAMASAMTASVDAADRGDLQAETAACVAERRLGEAGEDFRYELEWWELALDEEGAVVGFHMPVAFRKGERDGQPEGTIFYIGVVPSMQGRGHGTALLARATAVLERAGVWRIFADTAEVNAPMKAAFRSVGYVEGPTREVRLKGRPSG